MAKILQENCLGMQELALFLLWRLLQFWLRYTPFNGIISHVFWQTKQRCLILVTKRWKFLWRAMDDSHECASGQNWPEVERCHPVNREMRSFHFDGLASLTALCRDWITCNVHGIAMSWRKKLPRISVATCLRTEHSGSFNVLNHWLCGLCNCHLWNRKSLCKISEPIGYYLRLRIEFSEW